MGAAALGGAGAGAAFGLGAAGFALAAWRAADLEWMLRQFEGNRAPYNEAVVEAAS